MLSWLKSPLGLSKKKKLFKLKKTVYFLDFIERFIIMYAYLTDNFIFQSAQHFKRNF